MAKKVRKDGERKEEKKVVFEASEFDEREYLTEQLHNIRATLFFIILAIPVGAAWAYTAASTGYTVAGLAVSIAGYLAGTQFLRLVMGIDLLEGPKRLLATTFMMYLFTSLAFAVVLSNPPANDLTPPSITDVVVLVQAPDGDGGEWEVLMRHRNTLRLNESNGDRLKDNPDQRMFLVEEGTSAIKGDNISILVRAGDASGLKRVVLTYGPNANDSSPQAMERVPESSWSELNIGGDYFLWGEHYYMLRIDNVTSGTIHYIVTVEDKVGLEKVFETKGSDEAIFVDDT
jgi:hypothetical protein